VANLSTVAKSKENTLVYSDIVSTLKKVNATLTHYEQVSKVYIVKDIWTPENELLTPTLKIRRNQIHNKYHTALFGLENDDRLVIWEKF